MFNSKAEGIFVYFFKKLYSKEYALKIFNIIHVNFFSEISLAEYNINYQPANINVDLTIHK